MPSSDKEGCRRIDWVVEMGRLMAIAHMLFVARGQLVASQGHAYTRISYNFASFLYGRREGIQKELGGLQSKA